MSQNDFDNRMQFAEDMREQGIKMLVVIINRGDSEKASKLLKDRNLHLQFTCLAQGTVGSEIMDLLGLGTADRTVILSMTPGHSVASMLSELTDKLKLNKRGRGIAFTVPVSGIVPMHLANNQDHLMLLHESMDKEVDLMNNDITHSVVIAVVNQGNSEELVETAKEAGATGGTIVNARRIGVEDAVRFLGVPIQVEKEIVAILVKREMKNAIMKVINDSFGAQSEARGFIISLPVDGVTGLR